MEVGKMEISTCVFFGALFTTFVSSVMADEQIIRLRNGSFGAIAGSAVGGFSCTGNFFRFFFYF